MKATEGRLIGDWRDKSASTEIPDIVLKAIIAPLYFLWLS